MATVSKSNDVITIKAIELGSATIAVTDGVVTRNISISVVESITFTVTDLPNWIENNSCVIFAWAWGGNAGGGEWYSITISGTTGTFSAPSDITGFNMARCVAGTSTPSWSAKGDSTGRVYNKTSDVSFLSGTTTYKSPDWVEYVP
mgnify:CR=1 FL=1